METDRQRVGVRELRQNLSVYLRRVKTGERLEVTEHGRPVALLAPLPSGMTATERLAAAGMLRPPSGDLLDLPAPSGRPTRTVSEALARDRDERQ